MTVTDATVTATPWRAWAAPARATLDGERVALAATAAGVALLPLAVPTGPANIAPIDVVVALAVTSCLLWAGAAAWRWRFPYALPVWLLLTGGALGALIGPVPDAGIVALTQDLVLIAWCWALVNIAHTAGNLKTLLTTWVYSSIGWAVIGLVGVVTGSALLAGQTANQGSRIQITLADPSYAASYFFISIMIIWATGRPRPRALRLGAYALLVTGIALTGSNSGTVSLVAGTVVAGLVGVYRRAGLVPAATALACVALGGFALASGISVADIQERAQSSRYAFIRDGIGRGTSFEERGMLLQESLRLFREGSVAGEGPVSTKPRLKKEMAPFQKEAHDDYVAALVERGALGFVGVLLLVAILGARALLLATSRLRAGFDAVVTRPNALIGAVGGTMLAMTVYELLHVRHVWALFAVLAAVVIWGCERR